MILNIFSHTYLQFLISSLVKYLLISLAHFLIELPVVLVFSYENSWYILDINPVLGLWFVSVFSQSAAETQYFFVYVFDGRKEWDWYLLRTYYVLAIVLGCWRSRNMSKTESLVSLGWGWRGEAWAPLSIPQAEKSESLESTHWGRRRQW